ncbi:MAG: DUF2384 domain-containing protein [Azospirillaceae bacterium]
MRREIHPEPAKRHDIARAYADPARLPASEPERIALWLSLDRPDGMTDVVLAKVVAHGLPVTSAKVFFDALKAASLSAPPIPEATLRRARKARKPLPKEHSERLYELSRVLDAVGRAYRGDTERMRAFLTRPHPMLGGETPFDLAGSSSAGADAVVNLIRRAEAGVAA